MRILVSITIFHKMHCTSTTAEYSTYKTMKQKQKAALSLNYQEIMDKDSGYIYYHTLQGNEHTMYFVLK